MTAAGRFRCCQCCRDDDGEDLDFDYHAEYGPDSHEIPCPTCDASPRLLAERDALAARLAAVEALADEWERRAALAESTADARAGLSDEVSLRQHAVVMSNRAHDLRAALAAPTDTTKEQS